MKNRKGQHMTEYILLTVAFVVVLAVIFGSGGYFERRLEDTMDVTIDMVVNVSTDLVFNGESPL